MWWQMVPYFISCRPGARKYGAAALRTSCPSIRNHADIISRIQVRETSKKSSYDSALTVDNPSPVVWGCVMSLAYAPRLDQVRRHTFRVPTVCQLSTWML